MYFKNEDPFLLMFGVGCKKEHHLHHCMQKRAPFASTIDHKIQLAGNFLGKIGSYKVI